MLTTATQGADIDNPDLKGLIPRITEQIFQSIVESDAHLEYLVKVSYMEIYLERIRDLLARECYTSWSLDGESSLAYSFSPERQSSSTRGEIKGCIREEFVRHSVQ